MAVFSLKQKGSFKSFKRFLKSGSDLDTWLVRRLKVYGIRGVQMLKQDTPKRTGQTALNWYYTIEKDKNGNYSLIFVNDFNVKGWANIVALIVYGHATRKGAWIEGRDFVTPVVDPIFKDLQDEITREVREFGS